MARPLFKIAQEIAADWQTPTSQAKAYLKGMCYLLGMDDRSADLDAGTTVRLFLLYSKEWKGEVADRIKAELQKMRADHRPTNAMLLAQESYPAVALTIDGCEMCDASLGSPAKFVDAYSHHGQRARMCMHCNYFLGQGIDFGDGALYVKRADGAWVHLHGEAKVLPSRAKKVPGSAPLKSTDYEPDMRLLVRKIIRRATKKAVGMVRGIFRKAG